MSSVDLGDFFRFVYVSRSSVIGGAAQPYVDGYTVKFGVYLGVRKVGNIKVDLSAHESPMDSPPAVIPAHRLILPKLRSFPYRLYPLSAQVADKVCATLSVHNGVPSSREKDLVDLVVIAVTMTIDADQTRLAIQHEARRRLLTLPEVFTAPANWGAVYASHAKNTPASGHTITDARKLMVSFIDPLLNGTITESAWSPADLAWVPVGEP